MKIGLSVSLCIADILRGRVQEDDVYAIVAGTCVRDGDWSSVLRSYGRDYWMLAAFDGYNKGAAVFRRLLDSGRIVQPRVNDQAPPTLTNGIWLDVPSAW